MLLDHGTVDGDRNLACFRVTKDLIKVGYNENEIMELIWNSRIPVDSSDKVYREVRDVVSRTFKKVV